MDHEALQGLSECPWADAATRHGSPMASDHFAGALALTDLGQERASPCASIEAHARSASSGESGR